MEGTLVMSSTCFYKHMNTQIMQIFHNSLSEVGVNFHSILNMGKLYGMAHTVVICRTHSFVPQWKCIFGFAMTPQILEGPTFLVENTVILESR